MVPSRSIPCPLWSDEVPRPGKAVTDWTQQVGPEARCHPQQGLAGSSWNGAPPRLLGRARSFLS